MKFFKIIILFALIATAFIMSAQAQEFDDEEAENGGGGGNEFGGSEGGEEGGFESPQSGQEESFDTFAASNQKLVHMLPKRRR